MPNPKNIRNFESVLRAGGFGFKNGKRIFGVKVINKTGSDIAADSLVALSGFDVTSKKMKIVLADADSANLATDVFVALNKITNGKEGNVYKGGLSNSNLNTNGVTTVGDPVYLDVAAGAFTATAPTASNARTVLVGYVTVKSATVGQIQWDVQPFQRIGTNDFQNGTDGTIQIATGTITSANITGTSAGQLGHANGVVLVAGGGAGTITQFVYALIENDFLTAAYTGGGVTGIKLAAGGAALSNTVAAAVFVQAAADISVELTPPPSLTVASVYPLNTGLNLVSASAPTQPGTAAGVIKWKLGYRVINSQLD